MTRRYSTLHCLEGPAHWDLRRSQQALRDPAVGSVHSRDPLLLKELVAFSCMSGRLQPRKGWDGSKQVLDSARFFHRQSWNIRRGISLLLRLAHCNQLLPTCSIYRAASSVHSNTGSGCSGKHMAPQSTAELLVSIWFSPRPDSVSLSYTSHLVATTMVI